MKWNLPRGRKLIGIILLAAVAVVLLVWAFSEPRRPFEYMVAGTFATAIALVAVFLILVKRGYR